MNTIIQQEIENRNKIFQKITQKFKEIRLSKLLYKSNFSKSKGIAVTVLFHYIFILVFSGKNLYRTFISREQHSFGKDTVYRFLNSSRYNWRKFLFLLSSSVIKILSRLTNDDRINVLVVDDSYYDRNRSKNVELLSKIHDHTDGAYKKGFKMLTLGWSDGNSFIPLSFSLLSSSKKNNRYCEVDSKIDKRTNGYKLRKESMKKSTEVLFDLIKGLKNYNIPAKHILFDSWFAFPKIISKLFKEGYHTIAMLKSMPKVLYEFNGKVYNLNRLYSVLKKRKNKAKCLASAVVRIKNDQSGEYNISAKIVFARDNEKQKKWVALISTDLDLEDDEIIRIYGKRWDIEVFFKMSKSYLKLAKEFQCRSYDAMVAHTTIVYTRYIMLEWINRDEIDDKTFGNLFFEYCDELKDITFIKSLKLILEAVEEIVIKNTKKSEKILDLIKEAVSKSILNFIGITQISYNCES